jgi:hypothetical protein
MYPGTSGTLTYSIVHSAEADAHGADSTGPSTADATVTITDFKGRFYLIEAATADAMVHLYQARPAVLP